MLGIHSVSLAPGPRRRLIAVVYAAITASGRSRSAKETAEPGLIWSHFPCHFPSASCYLLSRFSSHFQPPSHFPSHCPSRFRPIFPPIFHPIAHCTHGSWTSSVEPTPYISLPSGKSSPSLPGVLLTTWASSKFSPWTCRFFQYFSKAMIFHLQSINAGMRMD